MKVLLRDLFEATVQKRSALSIVSICNKHSLPPAIHCVALVMLFAVPVFPQGPTENKSAIATESAPKSTTVGLTIDFGDGFSKVYGSVPWQADLHVSDLMDAAGKHAHPTKFTTRGNQSTAFLMSIDGVENQGFGKKSWIFYLNGKKGEASFGTVCLQPNDRVLWKYQKFP